MALKVSLIHYNNFSQVCKILCLAQLQVGVVKGTFSFKAMAIDSTSMVRGVVSYIVHVYLVLYLCAIMYYATVTSFTFSIPKYIQTVFCLEEKQGVLVNNECSSWYNRVGNFLAVSTWNTCTPQKLGQAPYMYAVCTK